MNFDVLLAILIFVWKPKVRLISSGQKPHFVIIYSCCIPFFRAMYLLAVWSSLEVADYKISLLRSASCFITFSIKNL